MSIKPEKKQPDDETQKNKGATTVAWISFGGVVIAAIIAAFAQIYPTLFERTPTPLSNIAPTETSSPFPDVPMTFTSITATATSLPTMFVHLPVPLGDDWLAGCISTLWQVYPSSIIPAEKGDGCWVEPVHAFSAENGDLDFLYERKGGSPEIYGLFAPLPESGSVTFTVRLQDLHNADLLMGIYDSPNINSQGLLLAILNGPVEKRSIIQKDPRTYETLQGSVAFAQEKGYSITFTFDSLYVGSRVNPALFVINPVSIPSSKKWLFLGYKALNGSYRINGTFLSFELK